MSPSCEKAGTTRFESRAKPEHLYKPVCPAQGVSWPCLKLSLRWRMCFSFLLVTKLPWSRQWGKAEGRGRHLHRSKQTVEVPELKGFEDLLEARKVAIPPVTTPA